MLKGWEGPSHIEYRNQRSHTPGENYGNLAKEQRKVSDYSQKEVPAGVIHNPRNPVAWAALGHPIENTENRTTPTSKTPDTPTQETPQNRGITPTISETKTSEPTSWASSTVPWESREWWNKNFRMNSGQKNTAEAGHDKVSPNPDGGVPVSVGKLPTAEEAPHKTAANQSSKVEAPSDTNLPKDTTTTAPDEWTYEEHDPKKQKETHQDSDGNLDTPISSNRGLSGEKIYKIGDNLLEDSSDTGAPDNAIKKVTPAEWTAIENNDYPHESGFDAAAKQSLVGFVRGSLQNDPNSAATMDSFLKGTQGLSYGESLALAENIPGVNKENLWVASIGGVRGYEDEKGKIQKSNSFEEFANSSKHDSTRQQNQAPLSEKLHSEHVNGYINPDEQNIVTSQPGEYTDMTNKTVNERMQTYRIPLAAQDRIREQIQIRTENRDTSAAAPIGSTTPYLTKSFEWVNVMDMWTTSEANTGDLSNGLWRDIAKNKFVDFVGWGPAFTTEIDTTTGRTVIPGMGVLVYPSGKQERGQDYGIGITNPDNRYGAPVGSIVSLQDPRCPVYKAGPDGTMKEIGYINSPDHQTYAGNGKFVGFDPFENPPPKPEKLPDTIKL